MTYDPHSLKDARDSIHIARDPYQSQVEGFEIHLGQEDLSAFLPFASIAETMPLNDQKLLESNPRQFLTQFGQVMINTARQRFREGGLGTPDDLEKFEANEAMRRDAEELSPEQAALLSSLRTAKSGAPS